MFTLFTVDLGNVYTDRVDWQTDKQMDGRTNRTRNATYNMNRINLECLKMFHKFYFHALSFWRLVYWHLYCA